MKQILKEIWQQLNNNYNRKLSSLKYCHRTSCINSIKSKVKTKNLSITKLKHLAKILIF